MVGNHCTFEIACTREGTFNFWALEVTDLVESKLREGSKVHNFEILNFGKFQVSK